MHNRTCFSFDSTNSIRWLSCSALAFASIASVRITGSFIPCPQHGRQAGASCFSKKKRRKKGGGGGAHLEKDVFEDDAAGGELGGELRDQLLPNFRPATRIQSLGAHLTAKLKRQKSRAGWLGGCGWGYGIF